MSKPSTKAKYKYNLKTYKEFRAPLKISEFDEIEKLRGDKSRPEFLRELVSEYKENHGID